ncbi:hypothetical protein KJ742_03645, partial [Patescibacteria group bacterium]|nr:hypothetical protein [Patescibacteria group bacterium]
YEIYAQRFNGDGYPVGFPIRVNQFRPNDQKNPKVGIDDAGNAIVVWQSYEQDGSGNGIFARKISPANKRYKEIRVNDYLLGEQKDPAVAVNEQGNFVVSWVSQRNQRETATDVFAKQFDSDGDPVSDEFEVSASPTKISSEPSVAIDSASNFMIVWQGSDEEGYWDIYGQLFNWKGNPKFSQDILVNTTTDYDQNNPSVVANYSKFVVVWESEYAHETLEKTFSNNINGQVFNGNGKKSGSEIEVTEPIYGHQNEADLIQISAFNILVVWQNYDKYNEKCWTVRGQTITTGGSVSGDPIMLNAEDERWSQHPVLASDSSGDVGAVWVGLNGTRYKKALNYKRAIEF